jgi:hypothetical protein
MARVLILYDNAADAGTLSGGSWSLPLSYMQDPRPTRRARSTSLDLANTTFRIALPTVRTFKALAFGPTNFTSSARYRIRAYSDADFTMETYDSGWTDIGIQAVPSLDLAWEDPNFWTGVQPIDDPDNAGIFVVHLFEEDETAKNWTFEIDDQANPEGFVEIGRLFMGLGWQPSINFSAESNNFRFIPNTTVMKSLGGTPYFVRRKSARSILLPFPYLPDTEVWNDVYRIQSISNLDKQVFVISDPDDTVNRNKRSFLGNLAELPAIQLLTVQIGDTFGASTAFEITEAL